MAPLSIPAAAELIHCWAMGKKIWGRAIHNTASATTRGQSDRSIEERRARGTTARVAAPNATRSCVTRPGVKWSRPIAMKRNDAPQMRTSDRNIAQSRGVNASRLVPWLVDSRR